MKGPNDRLIVRHHKAQEHIDKVMAPIKKRRSIAMRLKASIDRLDDKISVLKYLMQIK